MSYFESEAEKQLHQEAFNKVRDHLLSQMDKSKDEHQGFWKYRDSLGRKCAIGCLIPDDEYNPEFDLGITDLEVVAKEVSSLKNLKVDFLRNLQQIHDRGFTYEWKHSLHRFAFIYGLTP